MPTMPAVLGAARLKNFRLKYASATLTKIRSTKITITVGGALANSRFRRGALSIRDVINESPSTCSFVADTTAPTVAQSLRITINSDGPRLLFQGAIQQVGATYEGKRSQECYPGSATDDLERLKRRRPFGKFTGVSASTVVDQLVAQYAPGFSTAAVAANLPVVSVIFDGSEGWESALQQIAGLIGGYYYIEENTIHLFATEATDAPDPIDTAHPALHDPPIAIDRDLSQVRTRVYGRGAGEALLADVVAGESILPVPSLAIYNAAGGKVIAESQRLAYTGVQAGGAGSVGSLVGPSQAPALAPYLQVVAGTEIAAGQHSWAFTWVTASGESLPSPIGTIVVGTPTAPATRPSVETASGSMYQGGDMHPGDSVVYAYAYSTASVVDDFTKETALSPVLGVTLLAVAGFPTVPQAPNIVPVPSSDPRVVWIHIWKTINGGPWVLVNHTGKQGVANSTIALNPGAYVQDYGTYGYTYAAATLNRVLISGIATGPSSVTARKLYRTAIGSSQLKLLATLSDNTTTNQIDAVPDASLTTNAPTSDTSGIAAPSGQVSAGSTTIPTASSGPFFSSGGWAVVGGGSARVIRYTGISGNSLTGIPASGPGSLELSLRYGEHIDPAASLIGVSGVGAAIARGTTVNLWIQRDDLAAQAAMAALDGGDGIYEYLAADERRSEASLTALCDAHLQIYGYPIITARYATRDVRTKSGKPITLTNIFGYSGTLTIQSVSISEIDIAPGLAPKFSVVASSVRVALETLLYQLIAERGAE